MFLLQLTAQDIDEWLVWELPADLQGSGHQHMGPLRLCPACKLGGQPRFADPCLSLEQHQLRTTCICTLVALNEGAEFGCSSQERAIQQVRRWLSW